ncbi:MAG: ribonuclease J [Hyphomicrobiaceae bacterium]|jgi:ribonuclease J
MSEQAPLRIIPMGGLGEFGMNCMVIERGDDAIAVDCGVMFPESHMMGIDSVIPDLSYLKSLGSRFKGFVLTHGHEDHIGALPHVLRDFDVPLFATRFTAGLIQARLVDNQVKASRGIQIYEDYERFMVGSIEVEAIPVTHSIVDACSLVIRVGGDTVIHTGDFKIDPTPVDGRHMGLDRLREIGDEGVRVLLSDSTNIESPGNSGSESEVRTKLEPMFAATEGRIVVSTFASHVHRMQAVFSLCQQFDRQVVILGRSMESNSNLASSTGHLTIPPGLLVGAKEAAKMPARHVCYLATGSQGEARSALSRMAMGEMKHLIPAPGDAVIYSSKVIPGNERPIGAVINQFLRAGVEVYYPRIAPAHVSGHAYREELRTMLELVRPEFFVPVHGEFRNLVHHARLGEETGVPHEKCFCLTNGDVIEVDGEGARPAGTVPVGRLLVDSGVIGTDASVLRDRRHISESGVVLAVLAVSRQTGEILSGPDLSARGLVTANGREPDLTAASEAVVKAVKAMTPAAIADLDELHEEVRLAVRRHFRRSIGVRPVVVPYVMEL